MSWRLVLQVSTGLNLCRKISVFLEIWFIGRVLDNPLECWGQVQKVKQCEATDFFNSRHTTIQTNLTNAKYTEQIIIKRQKPQMNKILQYLKTIQLLFSTFTNLYNMSQPNQPNTIQNSQEQPNQDRTSSNNRTHTNPPTTTWNPPETTGKQLEEHKLM